MKFAVGYQLPDEDEEPFVEIVREFRDRIEEVYFPWVDMPSGRSPMATASGLDRETARRMLEADLAELRAMGVKLDLLLNASCYGHTACSREFAGQVRRVVVHLVETVGLEVVTTMSPMIAEVVKKDFPEIDIRASVNMRLGTIRAMEYVAHLFDSYYVQREFNRDPERLADLKGWADAHGKGLYMLANSGCLNWCSVQTYHDNLVSHERDIDIESALDSPPLCWYLYHDRANWVRFLQNSWVRPEDIHHYRDIFPIVKLATRMHANPRMVIEAYCTGRFRGNLPDLLEPGHGPVFAPYVIDNSRFPADWFEQTTGCGGRCHKCDYCRSVLKEVLVEAWQAGHPASTPGPSMSRRKAPNTKHDKLIRPAVDCLYGQ